MKGNTKIVSMVLAVGFVGLIAYWVIKASMPLPAPEVTYSVFSQEVRSEVAFPYPCEEAIRVFRSENDGLSWDRITPLVYRAGEESCVFPDTFADFSHGASRLLYRYAAVDSRRNLSHWSNITSIPLSGRESAE